MQDVYARLSVTLENSPILRHWQSVTLKHDQPASHMHTYLHTAEVVWVPTHLLWAGTQTTDNAYVFR